MPDMPPEFKQQGKILIPAKHAIKVRDTTFVVTCHPDLVISDLLTVLIGGLYSLEDEKVDRVLRWFKKTPIGKNLLSECNDLGEDDDGAGGSPPGELAGGSDLRPAPGSEGDPGADHEAGDGAGEDA